MGETIVFAWRERGYFLFKTAQEFQEWMKPLGLECTLEPDKLFNKVYWPGFTESGTPVSNCQGLAGPVRDKNYRQVRDEV